MINVTLTDQQLSNLLVVLDTALKTGGLSVLNIVVDLRNVLASAKKVEEEKEES